MQPPKEKEKKKFIAPEEKAKQNMAKSLFGPKGITSKPAPAAPSKPQEQQKKKVEKVETIDLI
jgi:hypothetical protein